MNISLRFVPMIKQKWQMSSWIRCFYGGKSDQVHSSRHRL